ncbi:hypothetical protein E2I00_019152, partial [Balaenoptera physalus]
MVLFLLLFFLLLPLAVLWRRRPSQDAGLSWLVRLQHRVAWGALCWAAAWQRKSLAQSTLHAGQSQQRALRRCLQGAQSPRCPLRGSTGSGEVAPKRKKPQRTVRFQNLKTSLPPSTANTEGPDPETLPRPEIAHSGFLPRGPHQSFLKLLGNSVASRGFYDVFGATDIGIFRNHLPLTKASQLQEEESGGQLLPPTSNQYRGEASLQATLLGLAALKKTCPEVLAPEGTARADGKELAEAIAAGNPGASLPRRAAELREALEQGPRGLALRLWPKLQPHGLYLLPPGGPFIELLPLKEGTREEAAPTVLLAEAQKGKEYELVLTDHTSLTRCRLGDVVQVVGAYNQCPVVRFICRLGQTLSVRGEDTGEDVFSEALGRAVGQWPGARLLDHGCVESSILDSSEGSAPHYEVFVALKGLRNLSEENRDKPCVPHHTPPSPTPASRRPFCFQLDHCLQEASARYKSLRFRGSVGPAQVH